MNWIFWILQLLLDVALCIGCIAYWRRTKKKNCPKICHNEVSLEVPLPSEKPVFLTPELPKIDAIPAMTTLNRRHSELLSEIEVDIEKALNFQISNHSYSHSLK